ncbi:MAG: PDZ domain-containing protein [Phycisphaerales bacterium]
MNTTRSAVLPLLLAAGLIIPLAACQQDRAARSNQLQADMRNLVADARDKVFPALVNIRTITLNYYGGKENKSEGAGSGTIVTPEGHVITNHHVIDRGVKYICTLADKTEIEADLVGDDPLTDLAVLKIRTDKLPKGYTLPIAEWGDSNKLIVGDTVMAMGSPLSLSRSVTLGIVSNDERVFSNTWSNDKEMDELEIDGETTGIFTRWIQHDALINPGNSGGPLVNLHGQIVGINTRGGNGMGFASPSSLARDVADKLIKNGEVVRSQAGLALKPIDKSGYSEGVFVNSVHDNPPGPAAKAGIKPGDVITKIDGKPVTVKFIEEVPPLLRYFADKPVGASVEIDYVRAGQPGKATIVTEKLLRERGDEAALRGWGVSVSEITERYARERRLKNTDGVLITGIRSGSPAALAEPALGWGDIVSEVGGKPVKNIKEFAEAYKAIMTPGIGNPEKIPENLLVRFDRRGKDNVTILKPRPKPDVDPTREIPKPWIGVAVQPVLRDLAKEMNLSAQGFRVTRVYPRTLAANSELKVGDIITAVGDTKVTPRTINDSGLFQRTVRQLKSDQKDTALTVLRDGKNVTVNVPLEKTRIGPEEARKQENKDFELSVREITFFDRDDYDWDESISGVLVEGAEPTGWAGQGGLGEGDLIIKINDTQIPDLETYRKTMDAITKAQPSRVTFVVLRGVNTSFKFVEPEWKPTVTEGKK